MAQLAPLTSPTLVLPALIASADDRARLRFLEFFVVTIRNPHTRRAYARAAGEFLAWVAERGVTSLGNVQPLHVGAWIEALGSEMNRRLWVRLHEKGGKRHEIPCHHNLEDYLTAYIDECGLHEDRKGSLFRTIARGTKRLSDTPLPQANAFAMVRRRAVAAEIGTAIGNHSFRATGITTYLKNGGTLETAAMMANHSSTRTTQLYDRRPDDVTLDEVERVLI